MDDKTRAVRVMLESMAPSRSIPLIKSFSLPYEEELVLIEREGKGKSLIEISIEHNISLETVKRRRKKALMRISNSL